MEAPVWSVAPLIRVLVLQVIMARRARPIIVWPILARMEAPVPL